MCIPESTLRAYLDGELTAADCDAVAAHLSGCERCRGLASATETRRARVQRLLHEVSPEEAPRPVVALAELRSRTSTEPAHAFRSGVVLKASLAAASVAIAAVGIWALLHATLHVPSTTSRNQSANASSPDVARFAQRANVGDSPLPDGRPMVTLRHATGLRSVRRASNVDRYVLLSDDMTAPEVGMVVRMKVPVAIPASGHAFGDDGRLYGEIEADVLVAQDGRPYAVRLVTQGRTPGGK